MSRWQILRSSNKFGIPVLLRDARHFAAINHFYVVINIKIVATKDGMMLSRWGIYELDHSFTGKILGKWQLRRFYFAMGTVLKYPIGSFNTVLWGTRCKIERFHTTSDSDPIFTFENTYPEILDQNLLFQIRIKSVNRNHRNSPTTTLDRIFTDPDLIRIGHSTKTL